MLLASEEAFAGVEICHNPRLGGYKRSRVIQIEIFGHILEVVLKTTVGRRLEKLDREAVVATVS